MDKLLSILSFIKVTAIADKEFLVKYKEYIKITRGKAHNRTLVSSNSALMGLLGWLSDYSYFDENEELWSIVEDIENYYSKKF